LRVFNELLGDYVEVPEFPSRVVSLAEDLTEILFMIGAGDVVVGVSSYCNRPAEASTRPRVGTYYRVSYSRLEQLKPDLILTTSAAQRRVNQELHNKGYPVFPIQLPTSVAGIIENVKRVGLLVNRCDAAAELEKKLIKVLNSVMSSALHNAASVYVEIDLGSPITVGQASYVNDMLSLMGLRNIYSTRRESYFEPDMEYVKRMDPDLIIYDPKPGDAGGYRRFAKLIEVRGWNNLRAVKENRIIITEGDVVAHYGPSLVLETMPNLLVQIKQMTGY